VLVLRPSRAGSQALSISGGADVPTHFRGPADQQRALDVLIKLTRARNAVTRALQRDLNAAGQHLTLAQFGALEAMLHLGPLCQKQLAAKLLTSPANMTMLINSLERRGWVARRRNQPDRRYSTVTLTARGRAEVTRLFTGHAVRVAGLFAVLSVEEQGVLGGLCRRLGRAAAAPGREAGALPRGKLGGLKSAECDGEKL